MAYKPGRSEISHRLCAIRYSHVCRTWRTWPGFLVLLSTAVMTCPVQLSTHINFTRRGQTPSFIWLKAQVTLPRSRVSLISW